jgi:phosphoadenosine phosphosulfate reductase
MRIGVLHARKQGSPGEHRHTIKLEKVGETLMRATRHRVVFDEEIGFRRPDRKGRSHMKASVAEVSASSNSTVAEATASSSSRPNAEELERRISSLGLEDALQVIVSSFEAGKLAVTSNFGPATLVVLHTLHKLGIRLPVIFIDTLHHFRETLAHVERVREKYDLDLRVYRPAPSREAFEAKYGPELWKRDLDLYQRVSKVEPFLEATRDLDGWITGRRREQASTRDDLPLVQDGRQLRVNPLAAWKRSEVWRFIMDNQIPYHPLHDLGYASIGDEPLTTPISEGEHERAGRWRGLGRTECGIHLV